jgi:hypothetical protein
MERQGKWLVLPPEIWGSITDYLGAEHIGRLKLTGDTVLWSRLSAPPAVKRLTFEFLKKRQNSWPAFVNDLHGVEDIEIRGKGFPSWQNALICAPIMPKTLRKLAIWNSTTGYLYFFHNEMDQAYSLREHLPYLETLICKLNITAKSTWQAQLPETLTHLSLAEWWSDQSLPPSLTILKVNSIRRSSVKAPRFPPQLVVFECFDIHLIPDVLDSLPASLRKLSSFTYQKIGFEADKVDRMPKELTHLELSLNPSIASLSPSAALITWPSTLNLLHINVLPMLLWKWLPPTLTKLRISSIPSSDLISAFPANPSRKGLMKICFEDLPSNLSHLNVSFDRPTLISFYGACESESALTTLENEQSRLFPPKLKLLECRNAQMTVEAAKQIPRSLVGLNILHMDPEVCGALPRDLKTLIVTRSIVTPELIKQLPPALTQLKLPMVRDNEVWIDVETGKEACHADLVQREPEKYGNKVKETSTLWQGEYLLPSTLTHLELQGHDYLDDRFVAALPKGLDYCDLVFALLITDLCISAFSRQLTVLDLSSSVLVTSRSFKDLPRQLWFLSLATSEEIHDEHIKYLPRTLQSIYLNHAIHLTNSCIKDLPPSAEDVNMKLNRRITPDSINDFPPYMRDKSLSGSFRAATWGIDDGELYIGN